MSYTPSVRTEADGSTEILNGNLRVTGGIGAHGSDPDTTAALASGDDFGNTRLLVGKDGGVQMVGFPAPTDPPALHAVAQADAVPGGTYLYAALWSDPITNGTTLAGATAAITLAESSAVTVTPPVAPPGVTTWLAVRSIDDGATWREIQDGDGFAIEAAVTDPIVDTDSRTFYFVLPDESLGNIAASGFSGVNMIANNIVQALASDNSTQATLLSTGEVTCSRGMGAWNKSAPETQPTISQTLIDAVSDLATKAALQAIKDALVATTQAGTTA